MSSLSRSARSTGTVMILTGISRLLGFARQAAVSAVFGATDSADVLNAVFSIPNNLRKLLAEGALSSAFIPVLSQTQGEEEGRGRKLVRELITFQVLVLAPLLILSVVFAGPVTRFLLNFHDPEQLDLAAKLFRWFIHYSLLISISAVLMGTLQSRDRFGVAAATPLVFSVCVIGSILLLHRSLGIYAMAVGVLAGGAAQILVQAPTFARLGFSFRPSFDFSSAEFRTTMRRWLPVVAASSVFAVNQQVAVLFASGLEDGSSSAITNAIVFWQLPQGIFAVSIMTVLFPRMSRESQNGDQAAAARTLRFGVEANVALLVPSAVIMALLSREIIAIALQRGAFELADTIRTSRVLMAYCAGMPSVTTFTFLQRFFYSNGNYRTPTVAAIVVAALSVSLSVWLKETTLGAAGLGLANSAGFTVGAIWLWRAARGILPDMRTAPVLSTLVRSLLATVPGALVAVASWQLGSDWWSRGSTLPGAAIIGGIGIVAAGSTIGMLLLLRVSAARMILRREVPNAEN